MATVDLLDPGPAALRSEDSDNFGSGSADMTGPSTPSSTPPSLTHDTSRARFHIKDLGCFATCLENSAKRAFPTRGRQFSRYTSVQVLLLMWEDDELGVDNELDGLHQMFRSYGFDTETWLIPSDNPHLELTIKAANFVKKYESEGCLLIVYYGGHAAINAARQSSWYCKSSLEFASISLEWSAIQTVFERAISDVLLLLDCCGAASAAPVAGRAITETIAACGWEAIAPVPGRWSFTGALIEVLDEWIDHSFSVAMLHSQVLSVLKHPQPERRGNKKRKVECRRTPVYIHTSAEPGIPSINLSRLNSKELPEDKTICVPAVSNGKVSMKAENSQNTSATYGLDSLTSSEPTGALKVPHVLISLALFEDQELELKSCSDWLGAFPALAKYAIVKGVYRSHSTLVIASVPVVIWDLLPDNPACSFIGYITSDNLLDLRENSKGTAKSEYNQAVDATRAGIFFPPMTMMTPATSAEPLDLMQWEPSDVLDAESSYSTHACFLPSYSSHDMSGAPFRSLGLQSIDNESILGMHGQGRPDSISAKGSSSNLAGDDRADDSKSETMMASKYELSKGVTVAQGTMPFNIKTMSDSAQRKFDRTGGGYTSGDNIGLGVAAHMGHSPRLTLTSWEGMEQQDIETEHNPQDLQYGEQHSRWEDLFERSVSSNRQLTTKHNMEASHTNASYFGTRLDQQDALDLSVGNRRTGIDPERRVSLRDAHLPNFKEQEEAAQLRLRNIKVEEWRSQVGDSTDADEETQHQFSSALTAPSTSTRRRARATSEIPGYLPIFVLTDIPRIKKDPTEGEGIDPVSDSESVRENQAKNGQLYFNPQAKGISAQDQILIQESRHMSDCPAYPYITDTRIQPPTAVETARRWNDVADTYSVVSRAASWGSRRRSEPSIDEIESIQNGSFLKRISFETDKEFKTGREKRSNPLIDTITNTVQKKSDDSKLKRKISAKDSRGRPEAVPFIKQEGKGNLAHPPGPVTSNRRGASNTKFW